MIREVSVAMTAEVEDRLVECLVREDGQEDLCLATYRCSTGSNRVTALVRQVIPPEPGDRYVHGNVTVTADYILRAAAVAQQDGCGLVLLHSHPGGVHWQSMSVADRDCESSYANLVRELTNLPLVGMTLATASRVWSARRWDRGTGQEVDCTHATNVRVVRDRLAMSWNDEISPPPAPTRRQIRTVSAWGEECQADLARRRVLVVGSGSVGLDVVVRLAASGVCNLTVMDFDIAKERNLDRLIGAKPRDVTLMRPKTHVARREAMGAVTAASPAVEVSNLSICEPAGLQLALDHDLIFSCVDRPWPRAVLNSLAYSDLIPVIDGGIGIDTHDDGTMRNATWRSHVIRPGRPCMSCNGQINLGEVKADQYQLSRDPSYIEGGEASPETTGQNVTVLSAGVTASLFAQYVSFSVAPAGMGEPGPLRYRLNTHELDALDHTTRPNCTVEFDEAVGDHRVVLTDRHIEAEELRQLASSPDVGKRLLRLLDDGAQAITRWLDRW